MPDHSDTRRTAPTGLRPTRVWDLPTRLFHWSLVALVVFNGITGHFAADLGTAWLERHLLSGYAILALILFRLVWGFAGNRHARFAGFVRGPRAVLDYLAALSGRRPAVAYVGHNPLGAWSVLAMLGALALQVGSGLFLSDEDLGVAAPLARHVANRTIDLMGTVHETGFWLLLALVAIHLSAIVFYRVAKGENLVRPMLTGDKPLSGVEDAHGGPWWLGLLILAVAAGAVALMVRLA
jgi:cytochrome b